MKQNKKDTSTTTGLSINIREERLAQNKKLKESKESNIVDIIKENAKKHFEEIFNRI